MQKSISRRYSIGGKQIVVFDDLFTSDEIKKLHQLLARLPYHLSEVDTPEMRHNRNWAANLPLPMATGTPSVAKERECLRPIDECEDAPDV